MKTLFKKPNHVSKSFYNFIWFTIIALIIGVLTKVVVMAIAGNGVSETLKFRTYMSEEDFSKNITTSATGLALQALIVIITLTIYPMTLRVMYKILIDKRKFGSKEYKGFKKEFIWFLAIFLILDATAIAIVINEVLTDGMLWNIENIFAIVSVLIPTPFVIGQLVWLKKLKAEIK